MATDEISDEIVLRVASLARLEIPQERVGLYRAQMASLLKHFEELGKVDTSGVEPLVTPTFITEAWREDEVQASLNRDELLKNAPETSGALFKVPRVV